MMNLAPPKQTVIPPSRLHIRKAVGFESTGPEQDSIINSDGQWIMVMGGEQAGKSYTAAEFAVERIVEFPAGKPVLVWLVGKKYEDTIREYEYMLNSFYKLGWVKNASNTSPKRPREIELADGTVVKTLSAHDPANIGREAPDITLGCEASQLGVISFNRLLGRATASHGYGFFSGTMESSFSWYAQTWTRFTAEGGGKRAYRLQSINNTALYPLGINDPGLIALREEVGEDYWRERILGIVIRPKHLVFADDFRADIHIGLPNGEGDVGYITGLPVEIAIDPGQNRSAHALLAFQTPPDSPIRVFDEIYSDKLSTLDMIDRAMSKPWWKDVIGGVIDVQGTIPQQSVPVPSRYWRDIAKVELRGRQVPVPFGIDLLKSFLAPDTKTSGPKIVFTDRAHGFLSEMGVEPSPLSGREDTYSWRMDRDGRILSKTPEDRYNHSSKALVYWLAAHFGDSSRMRTAPARMMPWR